MTIIIYYSGSPFFTLSTMPRVSREQSDKNRVAIEDASARLFRERGLNGVTVAEVMGAAKLTHGGFYGHFASKEALAAVACAKGFEQSSRAWAARIAAADGKPAALDAILEIYLSAAHRDHHGHGCMAGALVGDVARESAASPVRRAYIDGIQSLANSLTSLNPSPRTRAARQRALAQLAAMVGAVALARATQGDELSDEILAATRHFLTGVAGTRA